MYIICIDFWHDKRNLNNNNNIQTAYNVTQLQLLSKMVCKNWLKADPFISIFSGKEESLQIKFTHCDVWHCLTHTFCWLCCVNTGNICITSRGQRGTFNSCSVWTPHITVQVYLCLPNNTFKATIARMHVYPCKNLEIYKYAGLYICYARSNYD